MQILQIHPVRLQPGCFTTFSVNFVSAESPLTDKISALNVSGLIRLEQEEAYGEIKITVQVKQWRHSFPVGINPPFTNVHFIFFCLPPKIHFRNSHAASNLRHSSNCLQIVRVCVFRGVGCWGKPGRGIQHFPTWRRWAPVGSHKRASNHPAAPLSPQWPPWVANFGKEKGGHRTHLELQLQFVELFLHFCSHRPGLYDLS